MHYLIHIANVLYLGSYTVKDILWLRLLTIVAGSVLLPYHYLQPTPNWAAIAWNLLFAALNLYQIYLLILERRPVHFTEREQLLYGRVFRSLKPREFVTLLKLASWEETAPGGRIVERGRDLGRMMVIAK